MLLDGEAEMIEPVTLPRGRHSHRAWNSCNAPRRTVVASSGNSSEINAAQTRVSANYLRQRATIDQLLALFFLIVFSPALLAMIALVRLTSKGPAIYRQLRVGIDGRVFTIYKFRTMRVDAEHGTGAVWSQPGDPRVTLVGRLLRWSHLDETLQLVNILRGEMAFIGPRPERPEIVDTLQHEIPGYLDRLEVLPGVTGLAQVTLPPDADMASVRRKLVMDRMYIQTASLALDLHILFCTLVLAFGLQRRMDTCTWHALAREFN
jgi:lipopolysaccharide/colanic/teichoic acid biosynthesis glycosyltransferase